MELPRTYPQSTYNFRLSSVTVLENSRGVVGLKEVQSRQNGIKVDYTLNRVGITTRPSIPALSWGTQDDVASLCMECPCSRKVEYSILLFGWVMQKMNLKVSKGRSKK